MKVFIGHRGVGKTELSKRVLSYLPATKIFDLDQEISEKVKMPVKDYIEQAGLRTFRQLEIETFHSLYETYKDHPHVLVILGAGYEGEIPEGVERLWVRRQTESRGRAFVNRPRLGKNFKASDDYLETYRERKRKFINQARGCDLMIREGAYSTHEGEKAFFQSDISVKNKIITLLPTHFKNPALKSWIEERLRWGFFFEFRTDLLKEENWLEVQKWIPKDALLYSIREGRHYDCSQGEPYWIDVDIEELPKWSPRLAVKILSAHRRHRGEPLEQFFERLDQKGEGLLLKAAPEIYNFEELKLGHEWFLRNKHRHVFLPRTPESVKSEAWWRWYRMWVLNQQSFSFIREGEGTHADQPTLLELLTVSKLGTEKFAAILGENVEHSFSPTYHESFFAQLNMPYLAIPISRKEKFAKVLSLLREWGLVAASVTAPYKKEAYLEVNGQVPVGVALPFCNTLVWDSSGVLKGAWSDPEGLEALLAEVPSTLKGSQKIVWGAGAMGSLLMSRLKEATQFSARSGKILSGKAPLKSAVLFWAAGSQAKWPEFIPMKVLDLDYTNFSTGLDFAVSYKIPYESGHKMFVEQAKIQQSFWKKHLA